jgi:hypothetical protein
MSTTFEGPQVSARVNDPASVDVAILSRFRPAPICPKRWNAAF